MRDRRRRKRRGAARRVQQKRVAVFMIQEAIFVSLSSFFFLLSPLPSLRGDGATLLPILKQAHTKSGKMAVDSPVGACLSPRRLMLASMKMYFRDY